MSKRYGGSVVTMTASGVTSETIDQMERVMDLNNQKRLTASQIVVELYEANQVEQLKILQAQITAALTMLVKP